MKGSPNRPFLPFTPGSADPSFSLAEPQVMKARAPSSFLPDTAPFCPRDRSPRCLPPAAPSLSRGTPHAGSGSSSCTAFAGDVCEVTLGRANSARSPGLSGDGRCSPFFRDLSWVPTTAETRGTLTSLFWSFEDDGNARVKPRELGCRLLSEAPAGPPTPALPSLCHAVGCLHPPTPGPSSELPPREPRPPRD